MFSKVLLFVFSLLAANSLISVYASKKLFLTVYYESLCPDSRDFVLKQLRPAMKLLPENIILDLVPFGKSKSINMGYNGFQCQHGPPECAGNMLQSCALYSLRSRPDAEKVEYVACEFQTRAGSTGNMSCVRKANIDPQEVMECLESGLGTDLQLEAEELTMQLKPTFVPTITVDGVFNQQIQESSLVDLIGTLCSFLKEVPVCAQHYNNMALTHLMNSRIYYK